MPKEIKPVQVSEKAVRNWRRNLLTGGIASGLLALANAGLCTWASFWTTATGDIYAMCAAILTGIATIILTWSAFGIYRDYRGSAWMKTFWEDGE